MPHRHEGIGSDTKHLTDRGIESAPRSGCTEQLRHGFVSPATPDICQERLTVPVREESGIVELTEAGQRVLCRVRKGPAHPHRGQGIDGAERGVFCHAFDEPERELCGRGDAGLPVAGDVILERVGQLVTDDVVEVAQCSADGKDDAPPQRLRDAPGTLPQIAPHRVGLSEFLRTGVENERLPPLELVIKERGKPGVPAFGHLTRDPRCVALGRVKVHVEVLGLEHVEVEGVILDFVTTEVLSVQREGVTQASDDETSRYPATNGPKPVHTKIMIQGGTPSRRDSRTGDPNPGSRPETNIPAGAGISGPEAGSGSGRSGARMAHGQTDRSRFFRC